MEEFYTVKEIAEILKVNKVTVQRWCKTKDLPAVKIGKSYRIEKNDFEEWYKQHSDRPEISKNKDRELAEGIYDVLERRTYLRKRIEQVKMVGDQRPYIQLVDSDVCPPVLPQLSLPPVILHDDPRLDICTFPILPKMDIRIFSLREKDLKRKGLEAPDPIAKKRSR